MGKCLEVLLIAAVLGKETPFRHFFLFCLLKGYQDVALQSLISSSQMIAFSS